MPYLLAVHALTHAVHAVSVEQARNLVRVAGLDDDDRDAMLRRINSEPEATLPIFEGLQAQEVKGVVQKYLERFKDGEKTSKTVLHWLHNCYPSDHRHNHNA